MDAFTLLRTALLAAAPGINLTSSATPPVDPRLLMTTDEICRSYGHQCEVHSVVTDDGYELVTHRVLPAAPFRAAILVISGIIGCSDNFFYFGKNDSLPFMLANAGYDVFLGNHRGSAYSRGHTKWTRKDKQYWKFSLDDLAQYDLPALVALTRRLSGSRQLFYVGFSAAGHSLYTLLELRPDLRDAFRAAILLSPAVFFTQRHHPFLQLLAIVPERAARMLVERASEVGGRTLALVDLVWQACRRDAPHQMRSACVAAVQAAFNVNPKKSDFSNLDFTLSHSMCGTSSVMSAHFIQMIKTKKLQRFDWGPEENVRRYGSEEPPEYLLQNISLPIASFIGRADRYVAVEDVQALARKSTRNLGVFVLPQKDWDHFDYFAHRRAPQLIYDRILAMLDTL